MISCRLLVTYLDRRPGLRLDSEAMGQHDLAEEFVGSNQASATRNYSAAIGSEHPATIRIDSRPPQHEKRQRLGTN